jgi:glucose-1-phosphate adenylyltransferase
MRNTIALLLAGGVGSRLSLLAQVRAKPAVTFGGNYRIIDFTLSNAANSGIENVGILTQYKPYSLMRHLGTGAAWDFIGRIRGAKILPPKTGWKESDWYRGTADAVAQNLDYLDRFQSDYVLILSGDHIYYMNYAELIDFHIAHHAKMTIATRIVPLEMAPEFGIAQVDENYKIINWEEKPQIPKSNLASMGIYLFSTDFLRLCLEKENMDGYDFGKNVIPWILRNHGAHAFPFDGYWQDVGTIKAYWDTNMDLLRPDSGLDIDKWMVRTNVEEEGMPGDRMATFFATTSKVTNSIISRDCQIAGEVMNSIISPGVVVEPGAVIRDSVIMHDAVIGKNAVIDQAIIDKNCVIGEKVMVGLGDETMPNKDFPKHLNSGLVLIGKNACVKPGIRLGRNSLVYYNTTDSDFTQMEYPAGATIYAKFNSQIPL